MRRAGSLPLIATCLASCLLATQGGIARARNAGITAEGCVGCHAGGKDGTVTMTLEPMAPDPGATATLTIRLSRTNGNNGGFYLWTRVGAFSAIAGQGTRLVSPLEVVHSAPKVAASGDIVWQVRWTAPAMGPGSADFDIAALTGNANGNRSGDGEAIGRASATYGCPGVDAFVDRDGDGFGLESTRTCELGPGFATKGGDCDDSIKTTYPGAPELCNFFDDNCDGQINEGLGSVVTYRDADLDGHGARGTTDMRMGCMNASGYASVADDCNDNDPQIHPGKMEVCNNKDDDCNGRVDEGARAYCGMGWCRRQAPGCDPTTCVPGPPRMEVCNAFDDDCDGVIDNDVKCDPGMSCVAGLCLTSEEAAMMAAMSMMPKEPGRDAGPVAPDAAMGSVDRGGPDPAPSTDGKDRARPRAGACALGDDGATSALLVLALVGLLLPLRRRR